MIGALATPEKRWHSEDIFRVSLSAAWYSDRTAGDNVSMARMNVVLIAKPEVPCTIVQLTNEAGRCCPIVQCPKIIQDVESKLLLANVRAETSRLLSCGLGVGESSRGGPALKSVTRAQ